VEYKIVKNTIPENIDFGTILSINTNSVTLNTHGFHKYPAKFIPQIPQWAINKYLKNRTNKLILEPFCGSGTTLVESALSGNYSIGIDIDPFSALISKVKTTKIDITKLNLIVDWLKKNIENPPKELFIPDCQTLEHWFTKETINKLSIIRTLVNQIVDSFEDEKTIKDIQDFLLICFSSIIRRVSNADNESQKTYVSHTKIKQPEEVFALFFSQLDYFVERITEFSSNPNLKPAEIIVSSSANSLTNLIQNRKVDLAITSPPYIKAIDYIYNQMAELFWIGDLFQMQTQSLQNEKKAHYIGNKQIPTSEFINYSPFTSKLNIEILDNKLQEVFKTDEKNGHRHSYVTHKYFVEMEKHFAEISKCLKQNAHYVMVVGDSKVSDIYFNTGDFLTTIAERNGFKLKNKWGYKIKNRFMRFDRKGRGGIIDIDWVLEFEKK
jgi:DNA modification methylase